MNKQEFFALVAVVKGEKKYVAINESNGEIMFSSQKDLAIRFDDRQQAKKFSSNKVKKLCIVVKVMDKF